MLGEKASSRFGTVGREGDLGTIFSVLDRFRLSYFYLLFFVIVFVMSPFPDITELDVALCSLQEPFAIMP